MQVTQRAALNEGVLEQLVAFNRSNRYLPPIEGQLETALEWLTTPDNIHGGLGYITLGRFVAGEGNILDLESGLNGNVVEDYSTPDGLYKTVLTTI